MAIIKKDGGFMSLPINIKRGNPIPLDSTAIWYDYAALETYAQSNPVAYVGQIVTWVDETNNTSKVYVITDIAGTLTEVGSGIELNADNNTIALDDNGSLKLKDFGIKYYRYVPATIDETTGNETSPARYELQIVDETHPWKSGLIPQVVVDPENANNFIIGWYEPNPTTLEGINTQITGLQNEVTNVKSNLANNYYTKEQARQEFGGAIQYRGLIATKEELDAKTDMVSGDVYIVQNTQTEYIYDGSKWEELGNQVNLSDFETRIGTLETTVNSHNTSIGTLNDSISSLQSITSELSPKVTTLETRVGTLDTTVQNLQSVIGTAEKTNEDGTISAATGLYKEMQDIASKAVGDLNAIKGISINGTDAPISAQKVTLFDFTQSNGLAGLVKPPTKEIMESSNTYVLSAKGDWVTPFDQRIGTLTYEGTTYNTVTEYIDARTTMTWQKITD